MKKIYTLALAALVAVGASAADKPLKALRPAATSLPQMRVANPASLRSANSRTLNPLAKHVLRAEEEETPEIIFDPVGTHTDYAATTGSFYSGMFGIDYLYSTMPSEIVWGENGDVYIRDLVAMAASGVYVKGRVEDGHIIVNFPQVAYYYDNGEWEDIMYATVCELYSLEYEGQTYLSYRNVEAEGEDLAVVYNIADDGSITLDLNDGDPADISNPPTYIIGLVYDPAPGEDEWAGFGDAYQTYAEFTDVATTLPEGIDLHTWAMLTDEFNGSAEIGFDNDNNVYFTNFWEYDPEVVMKGRVEGDKVVIPSGQYLGIVNGYYIYTGACEWDDESWENYTMLDALVMNYDEDAARMDTDNPLIDFLFLTSPEDGLIADYITNPSFIYQTDEEVNAAPANPSVVYFEDYSYHDWLGASEGYIEWDIPNVNVNGYLLDTSRMYYHFLMNGEVMTLTTEEFPEFDQDYTDIPYDYTDGWDLQVLDEDHYFSFRWEDYESFGLQSFFVGSDGVTYASDLITYIPDSVGVERISTSGREVKSVDYYDLHGRRVAAPAAGVYVARYTFADGTSTAAKVLVK